MVLLAAALDALDWLAVITETVVAPAADVAPLVYAGLVASA